MLQIKRNPCGPRFPFICSDHIPFGRDGFGSILKGDSLSRFCNLQLMKGDEVVCDWLCKKPFPQFRERFPGFKVS